MPSKFCCCLPLNCGINLLGIIQWLGVSAGITLLIMNLNGAIITNYHYEFPLMLIVAYTPPAFAWFAQIFSHQNSTKKWFSAIYFISHFIVESYALIVPIVSLHA